MRRARGKGPGRWLGTLLLAALVVGFASIGCEVFVPGDLPPYTCRGSDPSTCPPNQYCEGVHCLPCDAQHCDGRSPDGGVATDGNGTPDGVSPADAPASDVIVADDSAACGTGALGCTCSASAVCQSRICADASVLPGFASVCTKPCCTSGDCPGGFACYGAGTGGNYCVRASALGRAATGAGLPGAACGAPGECRSGVCTAGRCLDTCCDDANCASPTVCTLSPNIDRHTTFVCAVHAGAPPRGACGGPAACASGVCASNTCRPSCCGRASALVDTYHACQLDNISSDAFASGTYPGSDAPGGDFGAVCAQDDQCKSRMCNVTTRTCSDFCCVDGDCTAFGAFVCRPTQRGPAPLTTQHLLCVPGP